MLVGGFTQATAVQLHFANGVRVHTSLRDGVVLAAAPIRLFQYAVEIVRTYPHGVVRIEKHPLNLWSSGLPKWVTG